MDSNLRPLSTSELLDRTFFLYRNHFALFVGIALLPAGIGLLMQLIGLSMGIGPIPTVNAPIPGQMPTFPPDFFASLVFELLVTGSTVFLGAYLAQGAGAYAVSMVQVGKKATIAESYRNVFGSFFKIVGVLICLFLLICAVCFLLMIPFVASLGMMGIGIPGKNIGLIVAGALLLIVTTLGSFVLLLYITARYSLIVPACLLDQTSVTGAFQRSSFLTKQSIIRIILVLVLIGIIRAVFGGVLMLPYYFSFIAHGGNPTYFAKVWVYLAQFLALTFAYPVAAIALALVYFDQRVRKEAFDLQTMMSALVHDDSATT